MIPHSDAVRRRMESMPALERELVRANWSTCVFGKTYHEAPAPASAVSRLKFVKFEDWRKRASVLWREAPKRAAVRADKMGDDTKRPSEPSAEYGRSALRWAQFQTAGRGGGREEPREARNQVTRRGDDDVKTPGGLDPRRVSVGTREITRAQGGFGGNGDAKQEIGLTQVGSASLSAERTRGQAARREGYEGARRRDGPTGNPRPGIWAENVSKKIGCVELQRKGTSTQQQAEPKRSCEGGRIRGCAASRKTAGLFRNLGGGGRPASASVDRKTQRVELRSPAKPKCAIQRNQPRAPGEGGEELREGHRTKTEAAKEPVRERYRVPERRGRKPRRAQRPAAPGGDGDAGYKDAQGGINAPEEGVIMKFRRWIGDGRGFAISLKRRPASRGKRMSCARRMRSVGQRETRGWQAIRTTQGASSSPSRTPPPWEHAPHPSLTDNAPAQLQSHRPAFAQLVLADGRLSTMSGSREVKKKVACSEKDSERVAEGGGRRAEGVGRRAPCDVDGRRSMKDCRCVGMPRRVTWHRQRVSRTKASRGIGQRLVRRTRRRERMARRIQAPWRELPPREYIIVLGAAIRFEATVADSEGERSGARRKGIGSAVWHWHYQSGRK
ncbi:hypothetical protein C8R47DRAFT_1064206 [Mycena vitilis]|nr:hypothetical protein C8R47DRAFT_1064206 [Mycena vitilis]